MSCALKWMPLVAALALAGCAREGYFDDRETDYAEAQLSKPLVLPETRDQRRYGNRMAVPESVGSFAAVGSDFRLSPPRALGVGSSMKPGSVARRQAGDVHWLVVGAEPAAVWGQLDGFIRQQGMSIQRQEPNQGLLATSAGDIRLRHGLHPGITEVYCERNGATQANCLQALEQYFASTTATASSSSLIVQRPAEQRVRPLLEKENDQWLLKLPFSLQRVYAELNHQLEADFIVEGERQLLESSPQRHDFLVEYMVASERERSMLEIIASPDVRQMSQTLRLVLKSTGPDSSVLTVSNESEREFSERDAHEVLERVADLLR
ncbi:outer membrane protein assembly factor BamC [Halomonas halocynthiae]|uniref:outer membrane protein assembly factor BamC n=1 Tax=Halomonas halocynthiae TaxID=176290 RepID=UPI00041590A4|nr:outer membrane protein assembly factor BamC [Halomonas halocynthiae]